MIKISAKAEYGARAILYLALNSSAKKPIQLEEISKAQKVPREFLVQVMSALTKARIVTGLRGARGGYVLRQNPENVVLKDVLEAIDGSISEFRCENNSFMQCCGQDECIFKPVWENLTQGIEKKLNEINFLDLCNDVRLKRKE